MVVDAGFAIPKEIEVVDISLGENKPMMVEVLYELKKFFSVEKIILAKETQRINPTLLKGITKVWNEDLEKLVNLRQHYYSKEIIENSLQLCHVLKLNGEELQIISGMLGLSGSSEEEQVIELIKRYNLQLLALTNGSEGSLLMTPSEKSYLSTPKVQVKDTVGAGDSFTASMVVGFAKGEPLSELHQKGVDISAFVCTQDGAMPDYNEIQILK